MTVAQRGASWQATLHYEGQRYRRQFSTKHEAQQWEADSKASLLRGELPAGVALSGRNDGAPETLQQLFEYVWERYWRAHRSADTHAINARAVIRVLGGSLPIRKVDAEAIDKLVIALRKANASNGTINRKLAALSRMLRVACEREWIVRVPKIETLKETGRRQFRVTPDLETAMRVELRAKGDEEFCNFVLFSLHTGLRQGEALNLRWQATDENAVRLDGRDTKSGKPRTVPLDAEGRRALSRQGMAHGEDPAGRVFPTLTKASVRHKWRWLAERLNLDREPAFVPHILRHEFCSRLADAGANAPLIQALAGHSSLQITQRYINLSPTAIQAAFDKIQRGPDVAEAAPQARHAA